MDLVESKCGELWLNTITRVTYVQKDFQIRTLIKQLDKISICHEISPNFRTT